MDPELKHQADEFFAQLGLTLSSATGVFVRQCLQRGKIPFELEADPFYSAGNVAELQRRLAAIDEKRGLVFKSMDDLEAMARD